MNDLLTPCTGGQAARRRWFALAACLVSGCLFEELEDPGALALVCGPSFAEGNLSATGVEVADSYLLTARAWLEESKYLEGEIEAELQQLQAALGLTPEASMGKSLGMAIRELIMKKFGVEVRINAARPTVGIDARAAFLESAICQREVGCGGDFDPSEAPFICRGPCDVAPGMLACGEFNRTRCVFRAPDTQCEGDCVGHCDYDSDSTMDCPGRCRGICMGSCSQHGDANRDGKLAFGECVGICDGACEGHCEVESAIGAKCKGVCSGDCVLTGGMLDCTMATTAVCEPLGGGQLECTGRCWGDFDSPDMLQECEASLACNSRSKANQVLRADWKLGAVAVEMSSNTELGSRDLRELLFMRLMLEQHLPRLLLLTERASLLAAAGEELGSAGVGNDVGAFALLLSNEGLSQETKHRLTECAPSVFEEAGAAVTHRLNPLNAALGSAISLQTGLVIVE